MDQSPTKVSESPQSSSFSTQTLGPSTVTTMPFQFHQDPTSDTNSESTVALPLDSTLTMAGLVNMPNAEGTWLTSLPQNVALDNYMIQPFMQLGLTSQSPMLQENQITTGAWNPAWTSTPWFTSASTINAGFGDAAHAVTTPEQSVPAQDTTFAPFLQWTEGGWTMPSSDQVSIPLRSSAQADSSTLGRDTPGVFQPQVIRLPQLDTVGGATSTTRSRTRRRKTDSDTGNGQPEPQRTRRRMGPANKRSLSFSEIPQPTSSTSFEPVAGQVTSMSAPTSPSGAGLANHSSPTSPTVSHMALATIQATPSGQGTSVVMFPSYNSRGEIKQCKNCFCINTPSWRRSILDKTLLCNACGLYEKLHKARRPWEKDGEGVLKVVRNSRSRRGSRTKSPRQRSPQRSPVDTVASVGTALTANAETSTSTSNIVPAPTTTDTLPIASSLIMEDPAFLQCSCCHKVDSASQLAVVEGLEPMVLCAECLTMLTLQTQS